MLVSQELQHGQRLVHKGGSESLGSRMGGDVGRSRPIYKVDLVLIH